MQNLSLEAFPISLQQKYLWILQQELDLDDFLVCSSISIRGAIDYDILELSIDKVINDYEILRTRFQIVKGMNIPVQVISDQAEFQIEFHDLIQLDNKQQQSELTEIFDRQKQIKFNLDRGNLLNISIVKLSSDRCVLLISVSAFCADRASIHNLVDRIVNTYKNFLLQEISDEILQYADISAWQNELMTEEDAAVGKEYWQKQDLNSSFSAKLPNERINLEKSQFQPKLTSFEIDRNLVAKIEAIAQNYQTCVSTFLLTCWQILLARLTGNYEIAIAVGCDGRNYQELESALGLLTKYLPIQNNLTEQTKFSQALTQLEEKIQEASQWGEYFSWDNLNFKDKLFFPFAFDFDRHSDTYAIEDITFTIENIYTCIDRFKVKLSCWNRNDALTAELHYDASLFDIETIERLKSQFQTILHSAIDNLETEISRLNIVDAIDRHKLLVEFNRASSSQSSYYCLHHWFEAQANKTPNAIAVVFEDERLTYQELNTKADRIAHYLISLGVKPETIVALCVERSLDLIIGLLSILKAGGAYLPIEPNLPPEALTYRLQDAQVSILLTQKHLQEKIEKFAIDTEHKIQVICCDRDRESTPTPLGMGLETNPYLAYIIYTSGSTGKPKGVAIEHRQILNYLTGILEKLNFPENANFAIVSTVAADLGNTSIFASLCTGGCLHIISEERATDPVALAEYCHRHPIDCLKIVPSHLSALLTSSNAKKFLPSQRLILGGEASTWELIEKVHRLVPDCQIFNHYGPTETTVGVLTYAVKFDDRNTKSRSEKVPLGNPLANTQIYLLDKYQQLVPIGVPGEIYIGGDNVARGYLNHPELTKEKFIENPDKNFVRANGHSHGGQVGERPLKTGGFLRSQDSETSPKPPPLQKTTLYRTGDLGRYRPDGTLEFLGRVDDQIKLHGYRIELGEIETALRQYPHVRDAIALLKEDKSNNKNLVAYFVAEVETLAEDLRIFLQQKLPEYMMPSHFIQLKALPLTANGKIDRASLPAPDELELETQKTFVAPRTPTEVTLAEIWAELLGREKVSIEDNFFEIGGDSIVSIQAIAKANQAGLRLTPKQIFEYQTIAKLATVACKNLVGANDHKNLVGANDHSPLRQTVTTEENTEENLITGLIPLAPIQKSFFELDLPEAHHWNQSILLELQREIDREQLQEAIEHLVRHHDLLRSRFYKDDGWKNQITESIPEITITQIDFSHLSEDEQKTAIEERSTQLQASLNLSAGKLIQVAIFNLSTHQPKRLLVIINHLVIDGVSWRILLSDLQTSLERLEKGKAIELPAKTTSYQKWAKLLQQYATTDKLKTELDYWCSESRRQIKSLPVDYPEGDNTENFARTLSVCLSATETKALLQEIPTIYHTQINDILLAALVKTFSEWTGETKLLVNLEGHGREEIFSDVNLSRTVGWFTTIFPVLLEIEQADSTDELIKTVKEQ
jgi:amino acid adenylation domain-containing protein